MQRPRRRSRFGPQLCAVAAALLLLLSVSLLYSRLTSDGSRQKRRQFPQSEAESLDDPFADDPLLRDSDSDLTGTARLSSADDRIDELDVVDDDALRVSNEEEILRGVESEEEEEDGSREHSGGSSSSSSSSKSNGYYFDHMTGVIRRAFDKRSIDEVDGWEDYSAAFDSGLATAEDRSKVAFGSDDVPVDEEVRGKMLQIQGVEDALLLKTGSRDSPLREGWGSWFDAKSNFLRRDRMFKSSLEVANPLNNPLLQDPDGVFTNGLTRGDKVVLKGLLSDFKKVPFLGKKPLGFSGYKGAAAAHDDHHTMRQNHATDDIAVDEDSALIEQNVLLGHEAEIKRVERKTLDENSNVNTHDGKSNQLYSRKLISEGDKGRERSLRKDGNIVELQDNRDQLRTLKHAADNAGSNSKMSEPVFADGKRWGYYPGLHPHLSFTNFMDAFFRKGKCSIRVFMVWNSPPWMFGTRHQRGLESLLFHHPNACIVVFSENIELDFFKDFTKDGFKVAVVMPNLEELLKNTLTSAFANVWHEWRITKFYPTHYSELVRLAALYKYGGIYLDSDVIVLRQLSSFNNAVGMENTSPVSLNGATMAFGKNSRFIKECLDEYYASYADTLLRWNGADLLGRVARNFSDRMDAVSKELDIQPSFIFFPISSRDIPRYFKAPSTDIEKAQEDALFQIILNGSYTFHFWDSITSALVPEPESLVARVINHRCIRCLDVL